MAENAYGSQESASELPPLEDLLREYSGSKGEQTIRKQGKSGDDIYNDKNARDEGNTRESSIDKENARKSSISTSTRSDSISTSRDSVSIDDDDTSTEMASATSHGKDDSPDDLDFIPPLTNTSAAIFVPITESTNLLSPPQFVPGSYEYHRAALTILTNHEAAVRNNIQGYYQREMRRINREAEARDPSFDYFTAVAEVRKQHEPALKDDLDSIIAKMRERDNPATDYSVKSVPLPDMDRVPITYVPLNSPREIAARGVMKVIAAATQEISSFDYHVRGMSDAIKVQMQAAALRQKQQQQGRMDVD
ncbi:hypothetical protein H0G86_008489 [Trichoderma simmonsii]|uniref:Uncharacterized protein n=1 Tax=Trichoderma simmonsii TaxID=1491479 RepID=A0A8G0LFM1_9HYPO|nr:hypothetical protein Trihar35433_6476 [Trichoderma harzianum]QYT01452.1 hypothetical protein H0G86_008489 [Trichoderma simmonsii]